MEHHEKFIREAIRLAEQGMQNNYGGPFGAVVVRDGEIIGRGNNRVLSTDDPTAHAEIVAIRDACQTLGYFQLEDCTLYCSSEPCPMCMGAIYWARPKAYYFASRKEDAAAHGFDDQYIYEEIHIQPEERVIPGRELLRDEGRVLFRKWDEKKDKVMY